VRITRWGNTYIIGKGSHVPERTGRYLYLWGEFYSGLYPAASEAVGKNALL